MVEEMMARGTALGARPRTAAENRGAVGEVKEELRQKIQARRQALGEADINVEFKEPQVHELTAEELERKERRRLQNRLAARRCRIKKKKLQMYSKEEFEKQVELQRALEGQVARIRAERDRLQEILDQHLQSGHCKFIKQEGDRTPACPYAASPPGLPVKREPDQEAPGYPCMSMNSSCTPMDSSTLFQSEPEGPCAPQGILQSLELPFALEGPFTSRLDSLLMDTAGDSPEGVWGRNLPSTSDSEYAAPTPQSCISPSESIYSPGPEVAGNQGFASIDLAAPPCTGCLSPSPDPTLADCRGERVASPASYPSRTEVCASESSHPFPGPTQEDLAATALRYLREMINEDDDVFLMEGEEDAVA